MTEPATWEEHLPPLTEAERAHWQGVIAAREANRPAPLSEAEQRELREYQASFSVGGAEDQRADEAITLLGKPETLVVVTGQQPGLLGGSLYTFYKAAGALFLAKRLAAAFQREVVPMFWLAGDDHDFDEASHASWVAESGERKNFQLAEPPEDQQGRPVADIPFGRDEWQRFREQLATDFPAEFGKDSPEGNHVSELLEAAYENGDATLATGAGKLLKEFFKNTGLVFVSPRLPFMRERSKTILRTEIETPLGSTQRVIAAADQLTAEGTTPTLHRPPDAVNLFVEQEGIRCRVRFDSTNKAFSVLTPGEHSAVVAEYTQNDLLQKLDSEPSLFSPNVVTRPVVQDAIFPTLSYVAGPGEQKYFRQLPSVYEQFGVMFPTITPRQNVMLIPPKARRALEKLEISSADLAAVHQRETEAALQQLHDQALATEETAALEQTIQQEAEGIRSAIKRLSDAMPGQAKNLNAAVSKLESALQKPLEKLEAAAVKDREQVSAVRANQWEKLASLLFPDGNLQERVDNLLLPWLLTESGELPQRLLDALAASADRNFTGIVLPELQPFK
jgi:bacillithiol biosynthesis cysteine-adding enzyme BshC